MGYRQVRSPKRGLAAKRGVSRSVVFLSLAVVVVLIGAGALYYYRAQAGGQVSKAESRPPNDVYTLNSKPQSSGYVTEYPTTQDSEPNAIALDSGGNVWFTLAGESAIAELSPANGTTKVFQLPEPKNYTLLSWGITVDSARHVVWFTDATTNSVWAFNETDVRFTQYVLPKPESSPYQITQDKQGNVWFTELEGDRLGEIMENGTLNEYTIPLTKAYNLEDNSTGPAGITISSDGTVWFAEVYGESIGSFSPATKQFEQYDLGGKVNAPTGIAMDAQGDLWFTQHGGSFVSRFDPSTGQLTTISTSVVGVLTSLPYFIQVDSGGNVWFNEHYGNAIARFSPGNDSLVEYEIPSKVASLGNISGALTLALSPRGQPWFTEFYTGKIGMVNTSMPVDLRVSLTGGEGQGMLGIGPGNESTVKLAVSYTGGPAGTPIMLSAYTVASDGGVAAATPGFDFAFAPAKGEGSFSSTLTISVPPSVAANGPAYSVTVSANSTTIIASEVIQLQT